MYVDPPVYNPNPGKYRKPGGRREVWKVYIGLAKLIREILAIQQAELVKPVAAVAEPQFVNEPVREKMRLGNGQFLASRIFASPVSASPPPATGMEP